ncbi:MAG: right-handed parallel beta-helix repeat-containing protein [Planctomycetota bacterium]
MSPIRNLLRVSTWTLGVCFTACMCYGRTVLYVDDDAPPGGDGASWSTAYHDLQDALAYARANPNVQDIHLGQGTYRPAGPGGDPAAHFALNDGLALMGGYAGHGAPSPDERNVVAYETILTGDLNGDDGPNFANDDENSYNVLLALQVDPTAVLDGITVSGGNANGAFPTHDRGGGLYVEGGHPTINSCTFRDNSATYGGGMHINAGGGTLTNCAFHHNLAVNYGGGLYNYNASPVLADCSFTENSVIVSFGAGLANYNSPATLLRCTFRDNWAPWGAGLGNTTNSNASLTDCLFDANAASGAGGGIYVNGSAGVTLTRCTFLSNDSYGDGGGAIVLSSSPTFTNCLFSSNWAAGSGGGFSFLGGGDPSFVNCQFKNNWAEQGVGGGAYVFSSSNPEFTRCVFDGNSAERGGAVDVLNSDGMALTACLLRGNVATQGKGGAIYAGPDSVVDLLSCAFSGNTAAGYGGGIYAYDDSVLTVENCTFGQNSTTSAYGGGIYNYSTTSPVVTSCILWGNTTGGGGGQSAQMYGGTPVVNHSCVEGGTGGWSGTGNTSSDPLLLDPLGPDGTAGTEDDDLRLTSGSPCINTGDPAFAAGPGETDLDGHARVLCERVDMGAYEFGIGDYNCDQSVNLTDFANWTACMTGPDAAPYPADCEPFDVELDQDVDLADFAGFQRALTGTS